MQLTSLEAYREIQPYLGNAQRQVMDIMSMFRLTGMTNMEIAKQLGWSINRVTPRVKELRDKGLVKEIGKRCCTVTGRKAIVWKQA